jgi:hypothetical protein
MVIPEPLLKEVVAAFNLAIEEISLVIPSEHKRKSEVHSGNGEKRYGNGPEDSLGYGFAKGKLNEKHLIEPIYFSYKPSLLDAIRHNLIRDDAFKWMKLSYSQIFSLYYAYIKPIILGKLRNIIYRR